MFILIPFIILSIYLGNVLGCAILCETIPTLNRVRPLVWKAPFLHLRYIKDMVANRKWSKLWDYVELPCKNLVMLCALVATIQAEEESSDAEV